MRAQFGRETIQMGFLADKKILITGLLSKHSLAYGIAKACHHEGAELALSLIHI